MIAFTISLSVGIFFSTSYYFTIHSQHYPPHKLEIDLKNFFNKLILQTFSFLCYIYTSFICGFHSAENPSFITQHYYVS